MSDTKITSIMEFMVQVACSGKQIHTIHRAGRVMSCVYHRQFDYSSSDRPLDAFQFSLDGTDITQDAAQRFLNSTRNK